ncbi:Syntaxin-binding protein 5-like [Liparis tanakae]|uniref:Syntaxin-binding protein 5-like n=1 Tax=Liparis tanakae TaxID=230148 RepID=A0A4Z2IKD7_9TELE|nr:Syntaxin-binding protein 5-like [Liparis tanakae]
MWAVVLSDARDNSFTRSRSSSVTSIDRESREAISSFHFCESYPRKNDVAVGPCVLVGTTQGTVLMVALSLPPGGDQRLQQPVGVSPCGSMVTLKGGILTMALLDATGALLPPAYEPWYDPNASDEEKEKSRRRRPASSPSSQDGPDPQFAVLLPSLRPLLDVNYLPLTDMRIARTFCFSNLGQALYLTSPTEIQRITYSQETCDNRQEMLIGETGAGKASRSLAQHIPGQGGMEGMKGAASGVVGDLARARIALDERGQKLGELEDRTAAMMASADSFSKHAHDMMLKYKDKKWYQL